MPITEPPEPDSVLALLLAALDDESDDRRAALLLRLMWLEADRDRQAQNPVRGNV